MLIALALSLPLAIAARPAPAADHLMTTPPATFKKVSSLVKLPDYLPGLGTLYVDPKTLPVGPFLGYNHKGKLVNIVYMVPSKDLDAHKNLNGLGEVAAGMKIDHTDIQYNPGHPGVEEPHYHIVQWLISPAAVKAEM
ncbi:MAG: hypothetical protein IT518_05175 [Burkholderiales bacterium]|nr:hypothetical protein [Burkholderiales bacterium]